MRPDEPVHNSPQNGGSRRAWIPKILVALLLLALSALALVLNARQAARREGEIRRKNLAAFDRAWETIRDRDFDPTLGGVDWPAIRDELRPRMAAAGSRRDGREVLREMLERLHQSHLAIVPGEALERATFAREAGAAGFDIRIVDRQALVDRVAEDSAAGRAGIRPGWELTQIDGTDVVAQLSRLEQETPPGPARRMRLIDAVAKGLHGPLGARRRLSFRDGDGQRVEKSVVLGTPPGLLAQVGNLPAGYVQMKVERLAGDIGLVALDAFIYPAYVMRTFNDAMESLLTARGVILDLRGNSGGLPEIVVGMLSWMTPETMTIGRLVTRDQEMPMVVSPRPRTYAGPLAVLVDERCVSGAELFAEAARRLPNARLFGASTAGAVLGGTILLLPTGDALMYPISYIRSPEGRTLEGVGVTPDFVVETTRADLLAGYDPVLGAALAWIESQPAPLGPRLRQERTAPPIAAPRAVAEIAPRAAEVLDASVEATGGRAAYRSLETRVSRSTVRAGRADGMGLTTTRTTYQARPDKILIVEESEYMGEGRVGSAAGLAWEKNLFTGARMLGTRRTQALLRLNRLDSPAGWREGLRRAEYLGIDPIDGHPADHLRLETQWGDSERQWYDTASGLLVRVSTRIPVAGGDVAADFRLSDYRWIDGVRLPFRIRVETLGRQTTLEVESVEQNIELNDDLFAIPEELR